MFVLDVKVTLIAARTQLFSRIIWMPLISPKELLGWMVSRVVL